MPAKTVAQRQLMDIAEHHPEEVYARNRSVLKMSHKQLHEFAATSGLKHKAGGKRLSRGAAKRMRARASGKGLDG